MAVSIPHIPKLWIMPDLNKTVAITKNTAISISLALALMFGYGITEVRHANTLNSIGHLERENTLLKAEMKEFQNGYVTKQELDNTMKLIQIQLATISDKISNP